MGKSLITARVQQNINDGRYGYSQNPIESSYTTASVIPGDFYQVQPMTVREMVTRKVNKSLCFCLLITIAVTFISYYIAMNFEAKLNNLDKEIVRINAENQDLQSELDRFKSFNNVDNKIGKFNLLQKADKVIEVTAMVKDTDKSLSSASKTSAEKFNWAIGY